jgi:hypothetical protein
VLGWAGNAGTGVRRDKNALHAPRDGGLEIGSASVNVGGRRRTPASLDGLGWVRFYLGPSCAQVVLPVLRDA